MPLDGNGYVRDGANTVSEREVEDHNRSDLVEGTLKGKYAV